MTYYPENLNISLSRLRNYYDYPFKLLIHNDNPAACITVGYVQNILHRPGVKLLIHNNTRNVGCFNSRMNCIRLMKENQSMQSQWFLFIDDDDVLLTPKLTKEYAPVINHNALVVHRLREVLSLINNPCYYSGRSEYIVEEKPKDGCVGIPYDMKTYFEFYGLIQPFIPTLYKIYGTEKIMEPDDVILMYMFRMFLEHKLGLTTEQMPEYMGRFASNNYSYALTFLEDRRGRYKIATGVADLRYGDNPTGISYISLYNEISAAFYKYLAELPKK
jgi:glycosyltransferase involved in cell wall biosynthesis